MASQIPLLATWDALGVVRFYEYSAGVFIQTGTLGGFAHSAPATGIGAMTAAFLQWNADDSAANVIRSVSSSQCQAVMISPAGSQLDAQFIGNATNQGAFRATKFLSESAIVTLSQYSGTGGVRKVTQDRYLAGGGQSLLDLAGVRIGLPKAKAVSPDGKRYVVAQIGGPVYVFEVTSAATAAPLTFAAKANAPFAIAADLMAWATDSKTLIVADTTQNRAQTWTYDSAADTWSFGYEIAIPTGVPTCIAVSPDARKVAISTLDGSTYRTRTYNRYGPFLVVDQDFTGVGQILDFSADGVLLLDCALRAAYVKQSNEQFAASATVLQNLPTGILSQAISKGRTDAYGSAQIYDHAIDAIVSGAIDLQSLKLTLLTSSAVFDSSDLTLSEVTGAGTNEVSGGGWPAGGVALANVALSETPGTVAITSDNVSRILTGSTATVRAAVIYESASGLPLVFLDFITDKVFAANRRITINFRDGQILNFSR